MDIRAIVEETLVKPMRELQARPSMTVTQERIATDEAIEQMRRVVKADQLLHMAPCDVELVLKRIDRLQMLADSYTSVSGKHESMIGELHKRFQNKAARDELLLWDEMADMVRDAFYAIHGPNE